MTIVAFPQTLFPNQALSFNGENAHVDMQVDAVDEKVGFTFHAPKDGDIQEIGIKLGPTIGAGIDVDVRIETVDLTTGYPSGTLWATNTNIVVSSVTSNQLITATLTANATVSQGDYVAVVCNIDALTSGNCKFRSQASTNRHQNSFPEAAINTGSWTASTSTPSPGIAVGYSDGTFPEIPGMWPIDGNLNRTYNSGSTPDEQGNIFQVPLRCRASGLWASLRSLANFDMVLYDTDGSTELMTIAHDGDVGGGSTDAAKGRLYYWKNPTGVVLEPNVNYRVAVRPTSVTDIMVHGQTVGKAEWFQMYGGGEACHQTSRTDAGSWAEQTKWRLDVGVIIDGFDIGGIPGSMSGGMQ